MILKSETLSDAKNDKGGLVGALQPASCAG
jgi:hypothetical protein